MFFNYCCKRPCCRCDNLDKKEKNYCEIKDKCDYDKCDKYNKCEFEKKEKCCCHINFEKKCCCNKDDDKRLEKNEYNYQNERNFDDKSYYGEYNNLGSFAYSDNEHGFEQNARKSYDKEDNRKPCNGDDFDYKSYTPNWENDRECKCEKDNKHDWDNKGCKPVKYICFPWDKY